MNLENLDIEQLVNVLKRSKGKVRDFLPLAEELMKTVWHIQDLIDINARLRYEIDGLRQEISELKKQKIILKKMPELYEYSKEIKTYDEEFASELDSDDVLKKLSDIAAQVVRDTLNPRKD